MGNRLFLAAAGLGIAALVLIFAFSPAPADAAGDGKNLKVLSKDLTKKQIRNIMKEISKAVDKSCDECHDLDDFAKDNDLKKKARDMFRLTNSINARLKKDGFKKRINCRTCHAGEAIPK